MSSASELLGSAMCSCSVLFLTHHCY
jgi:hypothetical protein